MAWIVITNYALTWNAATSTGTISLWFASGPPFNPNVPHRQLPNLRADQYAAIAQTLRGDTDHKVFFENQQGFISSGAEPV
jgi:hypothetical protein